MQLNEKIKLNKKLLEKIQNKKMNDENFIRISKNIDKIKETQIDSFNDDSLFEEGSINLIYSLPTNSFILAGDNNKNLYLVKIIDIVNDKFIKNEDDKNSYKILSNSNISTEIYRSFDLYLNAKYKVKLNEKTLERVKNYFK